MISRKTIEKICDIYKGDDQVCERQKGKITKKRPEKRRNAFLAYSLFERRDTRVFFFLCKEVAAG